MTKPKHVISRRCQRIKSNGEPCKCWAMYGRKYCRKHGGKALVGIASPFYKTGKHSKFLPERMREFYKVALADPEPLNQQADIALLDARLTDVLKRVDTGETGEAWQALSKELDSFQEAMQKGDQQKMAVHWKAIRALIGRGLSDYAAWGEVRTLIRERSALIKGERERIKDAQQYLSSEQAMGLVSTLVNSVINHVKDPHARAAIQADLNRILAYAPGGMDE